MTTENKVTNYGVPYKGSKSRLAKDILNLLPRGNRLVELFAGGCALTHYAILHDHYKEYLLNDIDTQGAEVFINALKGEYNDSKYETFCPSKSEFDEMKFDDAFISIVYSFGTNRTDYLWGKNVEKMNVYAHKMLTAPTKEERRKFYMGFAKEVAKHIKQKDITSPYSLPSLQRIERLQKMTLTDRELPKITISKKDYREVELLPNDVVYCDSPYYGTRQYRHQKFNHLEFDKWLREKTSEENAPLFVISELDLPSDFITIFEKPQNFTINANGITNVVEKVFIHQSQIEKYNNLLNKKENETDD